MQAIHDGAPFCVGLPLERGYERRLTGTHCAEFREVVVLGALDGVPPERRVRVEEAWADVHRRRDASIDEERQTVRHHLGTAVVEVHPDGSIRERRTVDEVSRDIV